jgi:hypothetical protein
MEFRKHGVQLIVEPAPAHGMLPTHLVAHARRHCDALREKPDRAWVLIDIETKSESQLGIPTLRDKLPKNHAILCSKPCFEIWTLLHLIDTGRHFPDCAKVNEALKKAWRNHFKSDFPPKKALADYSLLIPLAPTAATRARKHRKSSPSWTDIFKLIDSLPPLHTV